MGFEKREGVEREGGGRTVVVVMMTVMVIVMIVSSTYVHMWVVRLGVCLFSFSSFAGIWTAVWKEWMGEGRKDGRKQEKQ